MKITDLNLFYSSQAFHKKMNNQLSKLRVREFLIKSSLKFRIFLKHKLSQKLIYRIAARY